MFSPLPKIEILLYLSIVLTTMYYLMRHVYDSGNALVKYGGDQDVVRGWKIFNRYQDTSDDEWMSWKYYISHVAPWLLCQITLAHISRYFFKKCLPFVYFLSTISFIVYYLGTDVTLLFLLNGIIFYFSSFLNSVPMVWFAGVVMLLANTYIFNVGKSLDEEATLMKDISLGWFILKSLDFCLSASESDYKERLTNYMAYAFYLPIFFFGPFMPFQDFNHKLHKNESLTYPKCRRFVFDLLRFSLWASVIEILTHFFYCNVLRYYIDDHTYIRNAWSFNGVGFCLSQYFFLKYFVFYGWGGSIAKLEGFDTPPPPKCVMRIHLYSKMWRYFDRGYYLFTVKCIYKPICRTPACSKQRKFFASTVCFCFVFLWHGMNRTILWWSILNFFGISLEAFGKYLSTLSFYDYFVKVCRTPENVRRFSCLLMSPVWVLAVTSNYFFFGGHHYGFKIIDQILNLHWHAISLTIVIAYCICQLAVEVENYEFRQSYKSKYHMKQS